MKVFDSRRMSLFCLVPLARYAMNRKERPVILARLSPPGRVVCTAHGAVPECWDTEPYVGNGVFDPCLSSLKRSLLGTNDGCARLDPPFVRSGSCGADVKEECYLVDPASSHMLVSKIKPCMCKYELIQTVKLRMAH